MANLNIKINRKKTLNRIAEMGSKVVTCGCAPKPESKNELLISENRSISTFQTEYDLSDYKWRDLENMRKIRIDVNIDSIALKSKQQTPNFSKDQIRALILVKEEGLLIVGDLNGNLRIFDKETLMIIQTLKLPLHLTGSKKIRNLYYLCGKSASIPRSILLCVRQDEATSEEKADIDIWDISSCREGKRARLFAALTKAIGYFSNNLYCLGIRSTNSRIYCSLATHDVDHKVSLLYLSLSLNGRHHTITRKHRFYFHPEEEIKAGSKVYHNKLLAFGGVLGVVYIITKSRSILKELRKIRVFEGKRKTFTVDSIVPSGSRGNLIFTGDTRNKINAWDCISGTCVFRLDLENMKIFTFGLIERKTPESYRGIMNTSKLNVGLIVGGFEAQKRRIGWYFIMIKNSIVERILTPEDNICDINKFYFSGLCPLQMEKRPSEAKQEFSVYQVLDSWTSPDNHIVKYSFVGSYGGIL